MVKTVILGGGISGLLAAYVLRGQDTTIIEKDAKLGGSYLDGGLKYIRQTDNMSNMLDDLRVPWTLSMPHGAILVAGVLRPHPWWVKYLSHEERLAIQKHHWERTRGSLDNFTETCMNDPVGHQHMAYNLDFRDLLESLIREVRNSCTVIEGEMVKSVTKDCVYTSVGTLPYQRLITTLPLRVSRTLFQHVSIPDVVALPLTIAHLLLLPPALENAKRVYKIPGNGYARPLDYIYTHDWQRAHRVSSQRMGWDVELAGIVTHPELVEPAFEGLIPTKLVITAGHLTPLAVPVNWPNNILPLGRFAEWNTRSTVEKSLDRVIKWTSGVHDE